MLCFARRIVSLAVIVAIVVACGSRTEVGLVGRDAGAAQSDAAAPSTCGNGACDATESCTTCPIECGLCATCGDGRCADGETCSSCAQDCGVCEACGDGFCRDGEDCLSCAPDCGSCPGCGDGTCAPGKETCFSCPEDCGACPDCGDGLCRNGETCASCTADCGVCAVCGNGKCEAPFETCTNCHGDCGDCETHGCLQMLTCSLRCLDNSTRPPTIRVSCVGDCVAQGCASARFFFDQAFNCFVRNFQECGLDQQCLFRACDSEVAPCLAERCAE